MIGMNIEPAEFRRILGHWATGVAVVAARTASGEPVGLTANAVASLSLEPPLVLVCVDCCSDTRDHIRAANAFSVNVLQADGERIARRFAENGQQKFEGIAWAEGSTGAPILQDALAWVDCRLTQVHEGGDHNIFVGQVIEGSARDGAPLLYYRGGFGRFSL
jgi:flavin reductase (DIM6/NTAB) family NADH-FMN oxidoreductase RutF